MKPSGAHTHAHSGGSHTIAVVTVIAAAALAATAAGPVAHVVATMLRAVLITVAATIVMAAAALVAVAVYRARHPHPPGQPPWLAARAVRPQANPDPSRAALGQPAPAIHLHLYGMSAQDVAQVLARPPITSNGQDRGDRHATP
jgi:hypothetical protein